MSDTQFRRLVLCLLSLIAYVVVGIYMEARIARRPDVWFIVVHVAVRAMLLYAAGQHLYRSVVGDAEN